MPKRKVLITGATRGIGRAIMEAFVKEEATVFCTGTKEQTNLPLPVNYMTVDFSTESAIIAFSEEIKHMEIDVLINNAGINIIAPFEDISIDDFNLIYRINLLTPFLLSQAVLSNMKEKKWGRIINIASIWSVISKSGRASYSASKFGIYGLTKALAAEMAEFNVLVNAVSPGFIDTELTKKSLTEQQIQVITAAIPSKRLGSPSEIAELVRWLASDLNTYISGQNIVADGGFTGV